MVDEPKTPDPVTEEPKTLDENAEPEQPKRASAIGITRKDKSEGKARRKMAKASRRKNRKK